MAAKKNFDRNKTNAKALENKTVAKVKKNKSVVAIAKCKDYADAEKAVESCLKHLGGMNSFVKKWDKVLLKINLLYGKAPEYAVTTNPEIVRAVINLVRKSGGIPTVGDSPGVSGIVSFESVVRKAKIRELCDELKVPLIELTDPVSATNKSAKLVHTFKISNKLNDFDVIINMPKLKTHMLTVITGAVKNLFGCVPGKTKAGFHLRQQDAVHFSEMLLDLQEIIKPNLTIMDAVVAMEGEGPGSGNPRKICAVIAGKSAVAVDRVAAEIIGFSEKEVPVIWLAKKRGIIEADLANIVVMGVPIKEIKVNDFKRARPIMRKLPMFLKNISKSILTAKPILIKEKCIGCENCMHICPADAIAMRDKKPVFDYKKCIRCYCCIEICPKKAITLKKGLLSKIFE